MVAGYFFARALMRKTILIALLLSLSAITHAVTGIPSGITDQVIYFDAVDSTDLVTPETGLSTFTVYRDRNGAGAAVMTTPTVAEVDATNMPGVYTLLLDEDMTIGSGNESEEMVFFITQADMAPVRLTVELYLRTADRVWDEVLTGATHNNPTSAGRRLRQVEQAFVHASGTIATVTNGHTFTLDSGAVATADYYIGDRLQLAEGTGAGQSRIIVGYTSGRVATLDSNYTTNPDTSTLYEIDAADVHVSVSDADLVEGFVATYTNTTTITLDSVADATTDFYIGELIIFTHGTGMGQAREITGYTSGRVVTMSPALVTALDTTTTYHIRASVSIPEIVDEVWDELLTGASHNISTSAGKRLRQAQESGQYEGGVVWIDTVNGAAGSVDFENGIQTNPVDNIADANTLSASLGVNRFRVVSGSTLTFAASQTSQFFVGDGLGSWTLALGGQDISGTTIQGAMVSGTGTGTTPFFLILCNIGAVTLDESTVINSCFTATLTLGEAGDYFFDSCFSGAAGTSTPSIDFGAALLNQNVSLRHYSGGIEVQNIGGAGTDNMSLEGFGQLVMNANCAGGTVAMRGTFTTTDNAGGAVTLSDDARFDVAQINSEADTALSDINLDHLLFLADADDVVDNSVIAMLANSGATADWSAYVNTTDSLMAIRDRGDVAWGGSSGDPSGIATTSALVGDDLNDLIYETEGGSGIQDGLVRAYLTSEYDVGTFTLRAFTRTDVNGEWGPIYLDAAAYTFTFEKVNVYGVSTQTATVPAP